MSSRRGLALRVGISSLAVFVVVFGLVVRNVSAAATVLVGDTTVEPTVDYNPTGVAEACLLYTSPSPRDRTRSRMPSSA